MKLKLPLGDLDSTNRELNVRQAVEKVELNESDWVGDQISSMITHL